MHSAILCASLCSLASPWGHSHRLQLFMSCSSTGPSHRVYSFSNRLLRSPTGSQILPANLFQCEPAALPWSSLWAPSRESAPAAGPPALTPSPPRCLQGCFSLTILPQLLQNAFYIFPDTFPERHRLRGSCGSGGNAVPGLQPPGARTQHRPPHTGSQNPRGTERAVYCTLIAQYTEFPRLKAALSIGK